MICATSVLLYPSLGPTEKSEGRPAFTQVLGEKGIKIFKKIFDSNNKELVNMFIQDEFVQMLWPLLMEKARYEHFFKKNVKPIPEIMPTYSEITKIMRGYHLRMG